MGIINDNFMLENKTARELYFGAAKDMPIIDYHCHLEIDKLAEDYVFADAYELFLGKDHYKWRQMRSFGIDEEYITGKADGYDKWLRFAEMMPYLIGNPLYHWTALELKRYFDIDEPLSKDTAKEIWDTCGEKLKRAEFSAKGLVAMSNVEVICTTDDPADNLENHKKLRAEGFKTKALPTFRPDAAVNIEGSSFSDYINARGIKSYDELIAWLKSRIEYFHENGCRVSDHGLGGVPFANGNAKDIFEKKMSGKEITAEEAEIYKTAVIRECAKEYSKKGWAMQLHMGAIRNNNSPMFEKLGADAGFDSIGDFCLAEKLSKLLNSLEKEDMLPKTILYNLNPKDNYVLGAMIGNFQKAPIKGKIQFGSAWWFNDNKTGMRNQLTTLAELGVLGGFIGMLTDSRSFVSYPRHEYFRRILCSLIGEWVENGEYPGDTAMLQNIVRGICSENAKEYFKF